MSMWADYIKEREGKESREYLDGFITYKIFFPECYIIDIYVKPECRGTHVATEMADDITRLAKEQGCTILTGSVSEGANGYQSSIRVLEGYGMKEFRKIGEMHYFFKEIT
jgi:ribosomal protein S18 acetylase RimI-like enzyme